MVVGLTVQPLLIQNLEWALANVISPDESLNVDSVTALNAGAGWSVLVDDDQTPARRLDDVRFTLHGVNSTRVSR